MLHKVEILEGDDEIVITGVSGQYPNCKNVKDFEYNLYNKVCVLKSSYIIKKNKHKIYKNI